MILEAHTHQSIMEANYDEIGRGGFQQQSYGPPATVLGV